MTRVIDQKTGQEQAEGKVCSKCGEWKELEEYYVRPEARDGRKNTCKECVKSGARQRRIDNPDRAREIDRKTRTKHADKRKERDKRWRSENKERCSENSKRWKSENPEKVAASGARYREKHKDEIREKQREYNSSHKAEQAEWQRNNRIKNPEKVRARDRANREANKEKINAANCEGMKARYASDPDFREERKAFARGYGKQWRSLNKDKSRVHVLARRARVAGAEGSHGVEDIKKINEGQNYKCVYCGVSTEIVFHVDHIIPLSRGGSNWPENLQILCPSCNVSKWAKTDEEYRDWLSKLNPGNDN